MAGFFGLFDYTKEGPGVSKNGPKKRPFVVFFEIYGRKFWNLISAGLLYLLVNLPLVTRGWAEAGLTRITRAYSREKHAFVREDFFESIRKNRGQAFAAGLINVLITTLLFFNMFYYATGLNPGLLAIFGVDVSGAKPMEPGILDYIVMAVTLLGYIIFTWMKYYIPFLVITFKLKLKQIYKNAFIFAVAGLKANLLISVVLIGIYVLMAALMLLIPHPLCFAIVLLLGLLLLPPFRSFLIQFCIFPTVRRLMIDPYYKDNPQADKQARLDLNLDVEETAPAPEDEPVFSDERPVEPEPTTFPKQYNEKELRRFNARRNNSRDDDDDTI